MAVTSKRERALQVVLVVWGVLTVVANIYPLVTSFLAGLRPTAATAAPMFWTMYATLGVFLVLAARNPSAYRSLIAFAVWSSFAHAAVMVLMAIQLPTKRGELLAGVALRSEEHTSELQSRSDLVCRLLLEKKKKTVHVRTRLHTSLR